MVYVRDIFHLFLVYFKYVFVTQILYACVNGDSLIQIFKLH